MDRLGSSVSGLAAGWQRSFSELAFEAGACVEDELNTLPDEDWAGQAPDRLSDPFLFENKLLDGERVRAPNSLGNGRGGPPIEDFVPEGGREGAVTGFAGGVFDQDRLRRPSCAAGYFEPDRSGPSSKFIRLDDDPAATAQEDPAKAASFLAAKDTNPITVPVAQATSFPGATRPTPPNEAQPPEPLAQLARMVGRGWARDRRAWMEKALGGGLGLLKSS
jgi:hypothetical protein